MSFINIKDPTKRDQIVKAFLATKKNIQKRNLNEKLGDMKQSEDTQKMFEPIIQSNILAAKEIGRDLVPIRKELEQLNQEIILGQQPVQAALPMITLKLLQRRRSYRASQLLINLVNLPVDHLRQAISSKSTNDSIFGIYNEGKSVLRLDQKM